MTANQPQASRDPRPIDVQAEIARLDRERIALQKEIDDFEPYTSRTLLIGLLAALVPISVGVVIGLTF